MMKKFTRLCLLVLCMVASVCAFATSPVDAKANAQAAVFGSGELNGCGGGGKEFRDCVAGVLDHMADRVAELPETQRALRAAAAGVRAAVNKAQALSAIAACRALITSALQRVHVMGGGKTLLEGWGREAGLTPLASVLARAAQLIQTKG